MSARIGIVVVVVAAIVASFTVFVVSERERAILFQLGKIVRDDYRPGIHFKVPFFQEVQKFDARIQTLDAAPELYLTKEKKNVKVDSYVKWRISDVNRYFTATGGSARRGASRLHALNQTDLKDAFGRRTIPEVVAEDRAEIMRELTVSLNEKARGLGMEVIDVRIKRIDLEEAVSNSVYQRMAAERKEVAKDRRSAARRNRRRSGRSPIGSGWSSSPRRPARRNGSGVRATGRRRRSTPGPTRGTRTSTASTAASTPTRHRFAPSPTCCCCSRTRTSSTSSRIRRAAASARVGIAPAFAARAAGTRERTGAGRGTPVR